MKWTCLLAVGCLLSCWGCAADPYAKYELGDARDPVASCIETMGGLDRWLQAAPVNADAVVTLYDGAGKAIVNKHHQVFHVPAGTLTASARLPDGSWTANVALGAAPAFQTAVAMPAARQELLLAALQTTLHRVRGPLNLLHGPARERAGGAAQVRAASMDLIRVPARGGAAGVKAYYFDAQTYLLRLVTAGGDGPGQEGTVTLYTYRVGRNGMAFPARLAVMKIGRHVLVGDQPVLEVDFHRVRF